MTLKRYVTFLINIGTGKEEISISDLASLVWKNLNLKEHF
jgi:nucleoside-diphosphate-sugar epimerase